MRCQQSIVTLFRTKEDLDCSDYSTGKPKEDEETLMFDLKITSDIHVSF
jgi:hypothetical protein